MNTQIKLLLADDHEIFLDGFNLMFRKDMDIKVIGQAGNGRELITKALTLNPDIVITDIHMPVMNGIEAAVELTRQLPAVGIIALSMANEESQVVEMLEAGAKGYLLKNADKKEIIAAIKSVYNNEYYYCENTGHKLATMIGESRFNSEQLTDSSNFTERQLEIIKLICQEYSYQEIADRLYLSKRTIEWHVNRIIEKIGVKNRTGIIVYAIRHKIFKNGF